jgi:hypothetical protein
MRPRAHHADASRAPERPGSMTARRLPGWAPVSPHGRARPGNSRLLRERFATCSGAVSGDVSDSSGVRPQRGQHRRTAIVQGRDRLGVRQAAGRDDRPRDTGRDGCQVSRRPVKAAVRPGRAKWIPAQVLVNRREEGEAAVGPDSTADQFVDGPRPALGLDDEPDMEREVRGSGEDRSIAADLPVPVLPTSTSRSVRRPGGQSSPLCPGWM